MQYKILSEQANVRNEDRAGVFCRAEYAIFVVADGAGGTGCGDQAAQDVMDYVGNIRLSTEDITTPAYWTKLMCDIDSYLIAKNHGGETTIVIATTYEGKLYGASVGDSSAWLVSEEKRIDLTTAQIRKPLVGSGRIHPVSFGPVLVKDSTLLLASDGLMDYTTPHKIEKAILDHHINAGNHLVNLVRLPSGNLQDDITVIVAVDF